MKITKAEWNNYIKTMSQLSDKASKEFADWANKNGGWEAIDRQLLAEVAWSFASKYAEGSSALAASMYDAIALAEKKNVPTAEVSADVEFGQLAKAVNGALKHSTNDDFVSSPVGRAVKQAGADTMLKNASRDGAEFAWIPSNDTCPFCLVLASNGWQRASKKTTNGNHAEHIHTHCDCQFAIRFNKNTKVEGYDPEEYQRMYYDAEGRTSAEKIKSLQAQYRQDNRDEINAQKRKNYADNKINQMKINSKTVWKGESKPITTKQLEELSKIASNKGFILDESFHSFDGDTKLVKDFLDYMGINLTDKDFMRNNKIRLSVSYSMEDETYAETKGSNITLNGFVYRDRGLLEKDYEKKVSEGWFTQGSTYYDVATHESAHIIFYMNQLKEKGIYENVFGKNKDASANDILDNISEYALANAKELIAESYVMYKNGSDNKYALNVLRYCGIL